VATHDERLGNDEVIGLRDAIVTTLSALFPQGPVTVTKHRGKWTHQSIREYSVQTPAIAIVYNGGSGWESNGEGTSTGYVSLTAFCMTADLTDGDVDDASLALSTLLFRIVPGNDFGVKGVAAAEGVDGLNAYVEQFDELGVNIHAVSWVHQVELPRLTEAERAALPDFLRAYTTVPMGDDDVPDELDNNNVREPMP
jgi:hypothetical protein